MTDASTTLQDQLRCTEDRKRSLENIKFLATEEFRRLRAVLEQRGQHPVDVRFHELQEELRLCEERERLQRVDMQRVEEMLAGATRAQVEARERVRAAIAAFWDRRTRLDCHRITTDVIDTYNSNKFDLATNLTGYQHRRLRELQERQQAMAEDLAGKDSALAMLRESIEFHSRADTISPLELEESQKAVEKLQKQVEWERINQTRLLQKLQDLECELEGKEVIGRRMFEENAELRGRVEELRLQAKQIMQRDRALMVLALQSGDQHHRLEQTMMLLKAAIINLDTDFPLITQVREKAARYVDREAIFKEAHSTLKVAVVQMAGQQVSGERWSITDEDINRLDEHRIRAVLRALQEMVVCFDSMPDATKRGLTTAAEIVNNADLLYALALHTMKHQNQLRAAAAAAAGNPGAAPSAAAPRRPRIRLTKKGAEDVLDPPELAAELPPPLPVKVVVAPLPPPPPPPAGVPAPTEPAARGKAPAQHRSASPRSPAAPATPTPATVSTGGPGAVNTAGPSTFAGKAAQPTAAPTTGQSAPSQPSARSLMSPPRSGSPAPTSPNHLRLRPEITAPTDPPGPREPRKHGSPSLVALQKSWQGVNRTLAGRRNSDTVAIRNSEGRSQSPPGYSQSTRKGTASPTPAPTLPTVVSPRNARPIASSEATATAATPPTVTVTSTPRGTAPAATTGPATAPDRRFPTMMLLKPESVPQ